MANTRAVLLSSLIVSALSVITLGLGSLAQGAPKTDPQRGNPDLKGEITIFSWSEPSYAVMLENFKKLYPGISVKFQTVGYADAYPRITTAFASNSPLADVVMIESERIELYGTRFPNAFSDLSGWGSKYERQFDRAKWSQSVVKGKLISMPTDAAPVGMWYRADFFEKAGVNPASIRTWNDYLEVGRKVIAANPGIRMAPLDGTGSETLLRALIQQQGSFYVDNDGRIAVNSAKMQTALRFLKSAWDAQLFLNISGTDGLIGAMKGNRVATMILPVWMIGIIKGFAPEQKGKWGSAPMPSFGAGGGQSAAIGGSTLMIPANSPNKEAAWAFVEYYTTFGSRVVLERRGAWPSFLPALQSPVLNTPDPFFATPNVFDPFKRNAFLSRPLRYSSDYDKAREVVIAAQASVLTGGASVEAALEKAARDLANSTGRSIAP